jgi:hypothetical protein
MVNRSANTPAYFNRLSTDGTIADFRKNGTSVGSIGTNGGRLSIGSGDVNLNFNASANSIYPISNVDGTLSDNLVDLGATAARFKDIHLRGSVYADLVRGFEDTDTYVNFAGSNVLSFITGASERARIDSQGNLLVGSTSFNTGAFGATKGINVAHTQPIVLLHETDTDKDCYIGLASSQMFLGTADAIPIRFHTSDAEKMRLDASGRLGIGTTSPSKELDVVGTIKATGADNSNTMELFGGTTTNQSFGLLVDAGTSAADYAARFRKSDNTVIMEVSGTGNVGIGTASPTAVLDCRRADASGKVAEFHNNSGFGIDIGTDSDSVGYISSGYTQAFAFKTDPSSGQVERMRLLSNGSFCIGGTAIQAVNSVSFAKETNGVTFDNNTSSGAGNGHEYQTFRRNSSQIGGITMNGTTGVSYNTSSDARLKDVTGEARGLEVINELNPVAYNWKADGRADEGLIAQEVSDIVPNAVSGSEEDMYQMDYSKLVTPLIKAVQELSNEVNELKQQIQNLTGE